MFCSGWICVVQIGLMGFKEVSVRRAKVVLGVVKEGGI